ncbi:unnamed protein product [Knipowitschia caucasica]
MSCLGPPAVELLFPATKKQNHRCHICHHAGNISCCHLRPDKASIPVSVSEPGVTKSVLRGRVSAGWQQLASDVMTTQLA